MREPEAPKSEISDDAKQASKQTSKQASKQTSKQASKPTFKQASKPTSQQARNQTPIGEALTVLPITAVEAEETTNTYRAGYTSKETEKISGFTGRQLDEWARRGGPVKPSIRESSGSGGPGRLYSFDDLLELKVVSVLLEAGLKIDTIKPIFDRVKKELKDHSSISNIVIIGQDVFVQREGQLEDVYRNPRQAALDLPVKPLKAELHEEIKSVRPELIPVDDQPEQLRLSI